MTDNFSWIFCEIDIAETLVDLRNSIPAGTILEDAPLLHEEVDELLLLLADLPEVVEVLPDIDVEVGLHSFDECLLSHFGDVVIDTRVMGFGVRELDGDLTLLLPWHRYSIGARNSTPLQQFRLDAASDERHWLPTSMTVDEPLPEVGRHLYIYIVFHTANLPILNHF